MHCSNDNNFCLRHLFFKSSGKILENSSGVRFPLFVYCYLVRSLAGKLFSEVTVKIAILTPVRGINYTCFTLLSSGSPNGIQKKGKIPGTPFGIFSPLIYKTQYINLFLTIPRIPGRWARIPEINHPSSKSHYKYIILDLVSHVQIHFSYISLSACTYMYIRISLLTSCKFILIIPGSSGHWLYMYVHLIYRRSHAVEPRQITDLLPQPMCHMPARWCHSNPRQLTFTHNARASRHPASWYLLVYCDHKGFVDELPVWQYIVVVCPKSYISYLDQTTCM